MSQDSCLYAKPGAKFPRFGAACCLLQNELIFMTLDATLLHGNDCLWRWITGQGQRAPQRRDTTLEGGAFCREGAPYADQNRSKPGQSQSARKGMVLECQGFFLVSDSEIWPVFFVCLTKFPTQNTCLHCLHKCIWDTWRSLPKLLLRLEKRLRRWGS